MIRLEGRSYLFFNSNTTFFSNEPLKSTDNIIIEYEEEYSKIITRLEKNHPELSKLEVLNKYIQLILQNNYTIILIEQVTEPPEPKRKITEIISPSTNINLNSKKSNYILVLYYEIICKTKNVERFETKRRLQHFYS